MGLNVLKPKINGLSSSNSSMTDQTANGNEKAVVDTDDIDENDESGQNILMGIISQLKPGCDLSRITLPTFILEKKSMLERITNQLQYPDILLEAHSTKNDLERFLLVVKWYLSGWHIAPKAVKKPLNPVLGEYFTAYWDLPNKQQAFYIAEQTSHHPPKSSYFYMIPESNIRVDGITIPISKFWGNSTAAMMKGLTVLQFLDIKDKDGKPEKYTLTQPDMYARGILFGKMRIELGDHMIIKSPKFQIDVDFKTKGFISGSYDMIEGVVKDYSGNEYYQISGKWNEVIYVKNLKEKTSKSVLFDATKSKPLKPSVRPLKEQGKYESRRLWKKVTDALALRDHTVATDEKFKIEDEQRTFAKERAEQGVEFHPKLFRKASNPDDDLEFYIYKHIPEDEDHESQIKSILEIAPILPGQKFTDRFDVSGLEKHKIQVDAAKE
ncbi:LAMI_0F11188g1_1 [Lachancea mirantina]|uniref:LAMI_0F11188g1_1 n=1 Tax=Lachancea mirantina TaxID=1230905 RepID=A0A1G4K2A2_9SACH|nr:LAMI_0F11188g1_1 [Lachancea mirantina]